MDKGSIDRTKHILKLTLEIIYLLTGEDYIIISKESGECVTTTSPRMPQEVTGSQSPILDPPLHSQICKKNNDLKMLELTNQIIYLLTGEACDYTDNDEFYGELISDDHQPCMPLASKSEATNPAIIDHTRSAVKNYIGEVQSEQTENKSTSSEGNLDTCEENDTKNAEKEFLSSHIKEEFKGEDILRDIESDHTQKQHKAVSNEEPESMNRKTQIQSTMSPQILPVIKTYNCSDCEETFTCKSELLKHQTHHRGSKLFMCSVCGKNFTSKSNLAKHQKIHTGEKPYSCSECGKRFREKYYLIAHQSVHLGAQLIECPQCGKGYTSKSNLAKHQRTHTGDKPFVCSECGKSFNQRSVLIIHHRTHTGEKPYSCHLCGKQFTAKLQLVRHCATHSGEKPFSCAECGKSFCQKYLLIKHLNTHK